ncbi:tRNA (N(6)-L-threonylcarbamoyladenosine(37)-C(2))-methylthiotransferase MtaB [Ruminococcus sp. Marseille-P6503]|uniref:tRNA (N(6)-L-threonylcarbamoyladenosine(37)-C(2))- methylthiotransferase MtaB n=1 Tax=Ruminococcus sp. Marseille-P6503 TaxID=2364796 RepID=UPI000F52DE99|nr:tRNA (N(6)-L-threonylcarbamoyladenosine(37)-C(2))-methylthiotransferase MtaB [Ruminococcus sp. Marseille-P6503]
MNVFYYTFGCKVNQYETENIRERLNKLGFGETGEIALAQICVINTCTVTAQSDSKCRQLIRRIKKENPACILAVTGCLPQAFPQDVQALSQCDIITGTKNKTALPELIMRYLSDGRRIVDIEEHSRNDRIEEMTNTFVEGKTRAYIKIQDGCDMHCSYCIIPKARGHIRSKPAEDIASEAARLSASGHKEIILTGINLCCYGRDFKDGTRLIDAVEAVCSVKGDFRVRLGSMEPEMISDEDIASMSRLEKLCGQFHLSLQSGCSKTLRLMNRHYEAEEYALLCEKLRKHFPGCAITTDIMVGFPQETDEDFQESLDFVRKIGFADAHIFPYSRRSGTAADRLSGQLDNYTKRKRAAEMSAVCAETKKAYLSSQIGKVRRVLFEKESSPDFHQGHTAEYVLVKIPRTSQEITLKRRFFDAEIIAAEDNFCIGRIIQPDY